MLAHLDGQLVACGAVVRRRLRHQGRELRAGYVEAVAVHPDYRRVGLASAAMAVIEAGLGRHDLLARSASEDGVELYEARGWDQWQGHTSVLRPWVSPARPRTTARSTCRAVASSWTRTTS